MRALRLAGKGLAAPRGEDRFPGFEIEARVDAVEIVADGTECIAPVLRQVRFPAGERLRHRLFQSCRHCATSSLFRWLETSQKLTKVSTFKTEKMILRSDFFDQSVSFMQ